MSSSKSAPRFLQALFFRLQELSLAGMTGEHRDEFVRQSSFVNITRTRIFALVLVLLQGPLIALDLRNRAQGLWDATPGYRSLHCLHVLIGCLFTVYFALTGIRRPRQPADVTGWHRFLVLAFAALGLLVSAAVSVADQMIHGQITVYLIASFWVAAGLYLGHLSSFILYFAATVLFVIGLRSYQHDPHVLTGHIINGALLSLLAWLLSRSLYMAKAREFVHEKTIYRQRLQVGEVEALRHKVEKEKLREAVGRATASLEESERKFRTLAETMRGGIVIHRREKFLYVNPAAEAITGYPHDEFLAMDFRGVIHPEYLDMVRKRAMARLEGKPAPVQYEFKIIRKDGQERWVLATAALIEYGRDPAIITILLDITDHKRGEEERARLDEENVRHYRERIEEEKRHQREKEKILMDIHDGIGGITTNIGLLAEVAQKAASPEDADRALATILRLAREGMGEIRGLMRSLDSRDLSWHMLIAELRSQGTSTLGPHKIAFEMAPEVEEGIGVPGSILCLNLFRIYRETLTNIIKHSKARHVNVGLRVAKGRLVLAVRDDGQGCNAALAAGKGRGLANMKARAAEIGGTVTFTADKGACVSVEIPLSPQSSARVIEPR